MSTAENSRAPTQRDPAGPDRAREATLRLPSAPNAGPYPEVLGNYRLVRKLDTGSTGCVFVATAVEASAVGPAGVPLAVKVLHPWLAQDLDAVERFVREGQVAAALDHPALARVHESSSATVDDITWHYHVQDLIGGRNLAQVLAEIGQLAEPFVRSIGAELASALAAAHALGLVHRDVKPANVMIVEGHAVLTDLGSAHVAAEAGRLTGAGAFLGTPLYAAPEQATGGAVGPASDLYGLGVVLYEALTGVQPFAADSVAAVLSRQVHHVPPPASSLAPHVSPFADELLARLLDKDPALRGSASEIAEALALGEGSAWWRAVESEAWERRERTHAALHAPWRAALGKRRVQVVTLGLLAIPVLGMLATRQDRDMPPPWVPPPTPFEIRRSLIVLGPSHSGGDTPGDAWPGVALGEVLRSELAADGRLRLVPADTAMRIRIELGLDDVDDLSASQLRAIYRSAEADLVVWGAWERDASDPERLEAVARLSDARTGDGLASVRRGGSLAGLTDLGRDLGRALREELGLPDVPPHPAGDTALPRGREATRAYCEGLDAWRRFDVVGARRLLDEAAHAEPDNPLAWFALARAWSCFGRTPEGREAAVKAEALSAGLPDETRVRVRALHETYLTPSRADATMARLMQMQPDDVEIGLERIARSTIFAGPAHWRAVMEPLLRIPSHEGGDPRLSLADAWSVGSTDPRRWMEKAAQAVERARARGQWIVQAHALLARGWAAESLDELDRSEFSFRRGARFFARARDPVHVARCRLGLAQVLLRRGRLHEAREELAACLPAFEKTRNPWRLHSLWTKHALISARQGRLAEAEKSAWNGDAAFRSTDTKVMHWETALALAEIRWRQGRSAEALVLLQDFGSDPYSSVTRELVGLLRCAILADRGDLVEGRQAALQARQIAGPLGQSLRYRELDLLDLGARLEQGEPTLPLPEYHGNEEMTARQDVLGARSLLALDLPEPAARLAARAAEWHRAQGQVAEEAHACSVQARALLAAGDPVAASAAICAARDAAAQAESPVPFLEVEVVEAKIRFALSPATYRELLELLNHVRRDARRCEMPLPELEARLAACEIELALGRPGAHAGLAVLARDAENRGYVRLACQARAASSLRPVSPSPALAIAAR